VTTESYVATVKTPDGGHQAVAFVAHDEGEKGRKVKDLEARGDAVVTVEPEQVVEAQAIQDPDYSKQWGIDRVNAAEAWDATGSQGGGVKVAVVDTGVQADHPDLAGRVVAGVDYIGLPGYGFDGRVDGNGHGTHVAGTIGEDANSVGGVGVAPQVTILPVRVLGCDGSGTTADVANGIYWAIDHGAQVINLSLGTSAQSQTVHDAVVAARDAGVVVVAAAGNKGTSGSPPLYPAADSGGLDNMLAVASTSQGDAHSSFSNSNDYVNIAAPGDTIWSTVPGGYGYKSGTSMSTPHVTGTVALLLGSCPGLSASQVVSRVTSTADDVGAPGRDPVFGFGIVRADRAVTGAC